MSTDSNFLKLSSQLGGVTLNGIVSQGTAIDLNVLKIDDNTAAQTLSKSATGKYLGVKIAGVQYYLPLYQ
jgi:hypothetical protein